MHCPNNQNTAFSTAMKKRLVVLFMLAMLVVSVHADQHKSKTDNQSESGDVSVICKQDPNSGLLNCESINVFNGESLMNNEPIAEGKSEQEVVFNQPDLDEKPVRVNRKYYPGEICIRESISSSQANVCASSVLAPQSGNRYVIGNLFDSKRNTAWVEGVSGNGIGESVSIDFETPQTVTYLELINGYTKSDSTFMKNSRIKSLIVTASNGKNHQITLEDSQHWQGYQFTGFEQVGWIQLRIDSVYPGTKYQDTAISELRLR